MFIWGFLCGAAAFAVGFFFFWKNNKTKVNQTLEIIAAGGDPKDVVAKVKELWGIKE
jgi:hypothetical protein